MGKFEQIVYGAFGVVALPFFPQIVLIAWLVEKAHGDGEPRATITGCAADVWSEWQHEFWRIT